MSQDINFGYFALGNILNYKSKPLIGSFNIVQNKPGVTMTESGEFKGRSFKLKQNIIYIKNSSKDRSFGQVANSMPETHIFFINGKFTGFHLL